jgi:uncharacterized protein YecE (DUF72 family)
MPARREEPSLFGNSPRDRAMEIVAPAPVSPESARLAAGLGPRVRLGTSSWSFPGWRGFVYAAKAPVSEIASKGLAAYAHQPLHATVGLDRSFYETPSIETLRALAAQVPSNFRFMVKAHQACTRPFLQSDGSTLGDVSAARLHGAINPRFLDAAWATDAVVGPIVEGLGASCGPILFQFAHIPIGKGEVLMSEHDLLDRLEAFLAGLPKGPRYAVEFRNDAMLRGTACRQFTQVLRAHAAMPGIGLIPSMPGAARQSIALREAGLDPSREPVLLVRWLLGHGLGYEEARSTYEPFDRLAAPDAAARHEIASLVAACLAAGGEAFVIVNNKAEGSAPLSIPPLAESIRAALAKAHQTLEPMPS